MKEHSSKNRNLRKRARISGFVILVLVAVTLFSGCIGDGGTKSIPDIREKTIPVSSPVVYTKTQIASPYEEILIGRWSKTTDEGSLFMHFDEAGDLLMALKLLDQEPVSNIGKYRFVSVNEIEMTFQVSGASGNYTRFAEIVSVNNTSLILKDRDTGEHSYLSRYPAVSAGTSTTSSTNGQPSNNIKEAIIGNWSKTTGKKVNLQFNNGVVVMSGTTSESGFTSLEGTYNIYNGNFIEMVFTISGSAKTRPMNYEVVTVTDRVLIIKKQEDGSLLSLEKVK